jgi:hypothetical protein
MDGGNLLANSDLLKIVRFGDGGLKKGWPISTNRLTLSGQRRQRRLKFVRG